MRKFVSFVLVVFCLYSCKNEHDTPENAIPRSNNFTDLQVDHFNIWVNEPLKGQQQLKELGFRFVPDSLSQIHHGQGTTGRFLYFLNTYMELIFIYDQNEFDKNNQLNSSLDFAERADFQNNGALPFSIALKIDDYNVNKIPFDNVKYHQDWMAENSSIYAAKTSKNNLLEPSVFVVYPEIEYDTFDTLSNLKNIPDEYAIWREFYKHPNGAKKITDIKIVSNGVDLNSKTVMALNRIENLSIETGKEHLMELYFDNQSQGKTFDLRPDLPLIVYL